MGDSRTKNVVRNSGASLIYKGCHIIIQFVLRTAFIRLLGVEYGGISTLFTDILNVLSLMELGMGSAISYALYKPLAERDGNRISALMEFYKKAYEVIGTAVLLVGLGCTPFLKYIVKNTPNIVEDIRLIFIMFVLTSASSYFLVYKGILFRADQRSSVLFKLDTIIQSIECIVEVVVIFVIRKYFAYLIIHFFTTLLRNVIVSRKSSKRYKKYFDIKDSHLSKQETKSLFKDIGALGIYKVSGTVINSTDSIVISAFIGTIEVSMLGNFTLIINSIRTAIDQIINALKPSVGNLAATSSDEKQESVFDQINFISFWVACFCCTCFYVLLNPFVGDIWFDEAFKISNTIIIVLTANFFIAVMVFPVETFRTANGLFIQGKFRPAIMAVLNIILDLLFVKSWGVLGVLLATTVSRLSTQVWFDPYLVFKNVFKKKPWGYYWLYVKYAAITACCCCISRFVSNIPVFTNTYIAFIFKMIITVIIPNAVLFLIYHNSKEFKILKGRVLSRFKKRQLVNKDYGA